MVRLLCKTVPVSIGVYFMDIIDFNTIVDVHDIYSLGWEDRIKCFIDILAHQDAGNSCPLSLDVRLRIAEEIKILLQMLLDDI